MLRVPCTGFLMEERDSIRMRTLQTLAQHLREQVVIAVPLPLIVQGEQKEIGLFQPLEHHLPLRLACHRLTERPTEMLQNGSLEQEALHVRRLARQYLLGQVVNDETVRTCERLHKMRYVLTALQRERSQLEASNPAFGACFKRHYVLSRKLDSARLRKEGGGFLLREAQVSCANLDQLTL